ncbi:hypothetical protein INR49_016010, partial [Caranx melampygus]
HTHTHLTDCYELRGLRGAGPDRDSPRTGGARPRMRRHTHHTLTDDCYELRLRGRTGPRQPSDRGSPAAHAQTHTHSLDDCYELRGSAGHCEKLRGAGPDFRLVARLSLTLGQGEPRPRMRKHTPTRSLTHSYWSVGTADRSSDRGSRPRMRRHTHTHFTGFYELRGSAGRCEKLRGAGPDRGFQTPLGQGEPDAHAQTHTHSLTHSYWPIGTADRCEKLRGAGPDFRLTHTTRSLTHSYWSVGTADRCEKLRGAGPDFRLVARVTSSPRTGGAGRACADTHTLISLAAMSYGGSAGRCEKLRGAGRTAGFRLVARLTSSPRTGGARPRMRRRTHTHFTGCYELRGLRGAGPDRGSPRTGGARPRMRRHTPTRSLTHSYWPVGTADRCDYEYGGAGTLANRGQAKPSPRTGTLSRACSRRGQLTAVVSKLRGAGPWSAGPSAAHAQSHTPTHSSRGAADRCDYELRGAGPLANRGQAKPSARTGTLSRACSP